MRVQPPVLVDTSKKVTLPVRGLPADVDTIRRNGKLDTIPKLGREKLLINWEPPDSTLSELIARKGYRRVQYQGDKVNFDSKSGLLKLYGEPAAVQRDETLIVSDTIIYNDSTKFVSARGDSVTLRDPTQTNADDFVVKGRIDYDLATRQASVGSFETSVEAGGDRLFLAAKGGQLFSDTLVNGRHEVYASDGSFTYCNLLEPHFHFTTKSMKFVSDNIMVARPGVLYIGEVPIFWIPFFFQDVRKGRRSGILTPNFGIAELVRNSPNYRRQLNNLGYYFSISDYMDAALSLDWRSGANSSLSDPGFVRTNLDYTYRWLNRALNGRFSAERMTLNNGSQNLSLTWSHAQDFSKQTRFTSNLNWVEFTQIQRQTTINPQSVTAVIRSQLNYQTKVGPASVNLGGSRSQYPGRKQVEMDFPSLTVSTAPLNLGPVTWTPGGTLGINGATNLDQGVQFPWVYSPKAGGGLDSSRLKASRRGLRASFNSPLTIFGFDLQNAFNLTERFQNYPEERTIINVNNPSDSTRRVFAKTFQTDFDWTTSFSLPVFLRGTFNIAPSVSFNNVDPAGGLAVRTERSGGRWVTQSKRPIVGVSTSPTLYAIFRGAGPVAQFRHAIRPTLSYNYSPEASVSDEFLSALGRTRRGYLGALVQNRISMGISTDLEAKLRAPVDSTGAPTENRKMQILSLNLSPLSWDFARADTTGVGLVESAVSLAARSDLLPGMDFRLAYSLFQGDPLSDTASFKLFRTDVGATFSLTNKSAIFAVIGRLLGFKDREIDVPAPGTRVPNVADDVITRNRSQQSAAGSDRRGNNVAIPEGQGWSLNLQYNASRQRPPVGGTIIDNDPAILCEPLRIQGEFAYSQCLLDAQTNPPAGSNTNNYVIGAPTYISPPTQNITSNLTFNVTRNWAAQWSTSYDVERARFASQQVGLQRQLHDWTTTFSFTQSPNGAFSFAFFIALKAQPSLKFDYNRATYRSTGGY
ncbi:MAG: LPS-assembly protein LptD [Phycisphaerae bacterium]|nr:LPS-assembly protein LptD [Gemmatimonadaceae bacterium]